jgi:hypothetical protein
MFSQKGFINSFLLFYAVITVAFLLSTHVDANSDWKSINRKVHVCWQYANDYQFDEQVDEKARATINNVKDIINKSWGGHSSLEFKGWISCKYELKDKDNIPEIKIIFDSPLADMDKESLPESMHGWPKGGYNSENNTITLRGDESNRIYMTLFGLALGFAPEAQRLDVFRDKLTKYDKEDINKFRNKNGSINNTFFDNAEFKKLGIEADFNYGHTIEASFNNEGICSQINKPLPVYNPDKHFIHDKDFKFKRLNYKEWQEQQAYNPYSVMNACISDREYEAIVKKEKGEFLSRDDIRMLQKIHGDRSPFNIRGHDDHVTSINFAPFGGAKWESTLSDGGGILTVPDAISANEAAGFYTYLTHSSTNNFFSVDDQRVITVPSRELTLNASVVKGDSTRVSFRVKTYQSRENVSTYYLENIEISGSKSKDYFIPLPLQSEYSNSETYTEVDMIFHDRDVEVEIYYSYVRDRSRKKHLINQKGDFFTGFHKQAQEDEYHFYNNGVQLNLEDALQVDNDINALYKNDYFVFTYTKDGEGKPESFLFKKKENSKTLLPVDDPLLICGLDDDPFVLTDPIARKRKQQLNQIKDKFSDIRIISGLLEELNLQEKQSLVSGKIWRANCELPMSSDSEYDIFYYDDPYGHVGEVITLFCNKTIGSIQHPYTFVDLNKEKDCVNFKEYLHEFVASDWKVFFRGNGFNGRLYALPNSYFENGNYNYDTFLLRMSKNTTRAVARKDFINSRIIFFTGTIDSAVYNSNKYYRYSSELDNTQPGYFINGIKLKPNLVREEIEKLDNHKRDNSIDPFNLVTEQKVTYAYKDIRLYRNGIPFTGSYHDLRNNDGRIDKLSSYAAGYINYARIDNDQILTINDFGGLSVLTFPFRPENLTQNSFNGFNTTSLGISNGYYVKSFPAHVICVEEHYCKDIRKGEDFKAFSNEPKDYIYAFVDNNPCTNTLLSHVRNNCSSSTPDEVLYYGDQPFNGSFYGGEYTNGKLN